MRTKELAFLTVGFLIASGALFVLSLQSPTLVHAEVVATPETVDLGIVEQGQKCPFVFQVRNTTTQPIKVVRLTPTCGCTELDDVTGRRIDVGELLRIRGILDTADRRNQTEAHPLLSYQTTPNEPEQTVILTIRANVRPKLRITPEPLEFDLDPSAGDAMTKDVTIDSDRFDQFLLHNVVPSASWITAKLVEREFLKGEAGAIPARLQVTIDRTAVAADDYWTASAANQSVRMQTTELSAPSLVVPIFIRNP